MLVATVTAMGEPVALVVPEWKSTWAREALVGTIWSSTRFAVRVAATPTQTAAALLGRAPAASAAHRRGLISAEADRAERGDCSVGEGFPATGRRGVHAGS